ncbi:hypothetical protein AVEN_219056-1, partial [Araneus ventricosus]
MALSCISSRIGVSVAERTLKDMMQELKRRSSGTGRSPTSLQPHSSHRLSESLTRSLCSPWLQYNEVDKMKFYSNKALFIHDSYKKDFYLDSAMNVSTDGLNGSKSLLDAYYALPVLNRKSLLNVTSSHSSKQPVA